MWLWRARKRERQNEWGVGEVKQSGNERIWAMGNSSYSGMRKTARRELFSRSLMWHTGLNFGIKHSVTHSSSVFLGKLFTSILVHFWGFWWEVHSCFIHLKVCLVYGNHLMLAVFSRPFRIKSPGMVSQSLDGVKWPCNLLSRPGCC